MQSTLMTPGLDAGLPTGPSKLMQQDEPSLWYEAAAAIPLPDMPPDAHPVSTAERSNMQAEAEAALEVEAARFAKELGKAALPAWYIA